MLSIDQKELFRQYFEQYYQSTYDFNTESLSSDEIAEIKKLAKEKRGDNNLEPIGTGIYDLILKENDNIRFEKVPFESEEIDGMLYISTNEEENVYIILNSSKPLITLNFIAAHEYYHYLTDYQRIKTMPCICNFSKLKDVNEMKACRFAAELLLPEQALQSEIKDFCQLYGSENVKELDVSSVASLIVLMSLKFQIPLKAIMYRLLEEHYIDSVDEYVNNEEFINKVLQRMKIFEEMVKRMYGKRDND